MYTTQIKFKEQQMFKHRKFFCENHGFEKNKTLRLYNHTVNKSITTKWHQRHLKKALKCTVDRQMFTLILSERSSVTVESICLSLPLKIEGV